MKDNTGLGTEAENHLNFPKPGQIDTTSSARQLSNRGRFSVFWGGTEMINRRDLVIGAGALTATAGHAWATGRPSPTVVLVVLRIYIPSPAVTYLGKTFNGGMKATLEASIDLDKSGAGSFTRGSRAFGPTKEYDSAATDTVAGKPGWYRSLKPGTTPIKQGHAEVSDTSINAIWSVPSQASYGCYLDVEGKNPLLTGAADIDAEITLGLRKTPGGAIEYILKGDHDGFPSYEIKLNEKIVYTHDCVPSDNPTDLFFPMDVVVDTGWRAL